MGEGQKCHAGYYKNPEATAEVMSDGGSIPAI
jgi:long-subunit acyl-CoA synthetase (AMP-forming)